MFGQTGREQRAAQPQIGRMIGGNRDDCGALAPPRAHVAFDEVGDFARALADQPDDDDLGLGTVGDHIEQHRLADPRSGDHADPLADPHGGQRIDRANADFEAFAHRAAVECAAALTPGRPPDLAAHRCTAVDRMAFAIDRAPEIGLAHGQHSGAALGSDAGAGAQHHRIAQQHHQSATVAEADGLGGDPVARAVDYAA